MCQNVRFEVLPSSATSNSLCVLPGSYQVLYVTSAGHVPVPAIDNDDGIYTQLLQQATGDDWGMYSGQMRFAFQQIVSVGPQASDLNSELCRENSELRREAARAAVMIP